MEQNVARIADALERIADALDRLAFVPVTTAPDAPTGCQHPESARVNFTSMGVGEEWVCSLLKGGCGFEGGARAPVGV